MKTILSIPCALVLLAAGVTASAPMQAQARDYDQVVKPYYDRHGTYKKVRSALFKQLKNDQVLSADAYFTLATTCEIEPPPDKSFILTQLSKSPCKKEAASYYLEAGRGGLPLGFLRAARLQGKTDTAFINAQLAYQLAGTDGTLKAHALEALSFILDGIPYNVAADQRAQVEAARLVDLGIYPVSGKTATRAMILAEAQQVPIPSQFHGRWVVGFNISIGYNGRLTGNSTECKAGPEQFMIVDRRNVYKGDEDPLPVSEVRILDESRIEIKQLNNGTTEVFGLVLNKIGSRFDLVGPGHNGVPFYKCP